MGPDTNHGVRDPFDRESLSDVPSQHIEVSTRLQRRERFNEVFGGQRAFLPVIHLQAGQDGAFIAIDIALGAGANGVFLINQGMNLDQTLALADRVRAKYPKLWLGLNPLGSSVGEAIEIVNKHQFGGLWMDDGGVDSGSREEIHSFRLDLAAALQATSWKGLFFGGTAFKTQNEIPLERLPKVASAAADFMDVVTSSGPGTNFAPSVEKVRLISENIRPLPLALASGIRPENVKDFLPYTDAFLVASGIEDSLGVLNRKRTTQLADLIHQK
jgi:hypothetical protein